MSYHEFTNHETGESYGSFEVFMYDLDSFSDCKGSDGLYYINSDCFTPDGGYLEEDLPKLVGFYWQVCYPGCLPDGEANGPFNTYQEALDSALSE